MNVNDLYIYLEAEFGKALVPERRSDGRAYYWRVTTKAPQSSRLLRVTENATGQVTEIKLAQSSIVADHNVFLPLPASLEEVSAAVHLELSRLLGK